MGESTSAVRQRRIEQAPGAIGGALRDCELGTPVAIEATGSLNKSADGRA